jgi:hypothetical protein
LDFALGIINRRKAILSKHSTPNRVNQGHYQLVCTRREQQRVTCEGSSGSFAKLAEQIEQRERSRPAHEETKSTQLFLMFFFLSATPLDSGERHRGSP